VKVLVEKAHNIDSSIWRNNFVTHIQYRMPLLESWTHKFEFVLVWCTFTHICILVVFPCILDMHVIIHEILTLLYIWSLVFRGIDFRINWLCSTHEDKWLWICISTQLSVPTQRVWPLILQILFNNCEYFAVEYEFLKSQSSLRGKNTLQWFFWVIITRKCVLVHYGFH